MTRSLTFPCALAAALAAAAPAGADEGMWTLDAFPAGKVERAYGFAPDATWLDHVRLSSARLAGGCSGSFVSASGLVLTNHHCAHACVEQLSRAGADLVKDGFLARTAAEERRCPDEEVDQLVSVADVTTRIRGATRGLDDIVGGNSGSPVLNGRAELVGLVFDGNIHSLGGEYGFDPATHRAVAVDSRGIVEALEQIYRARRILEEVGVRAGRR